MARTFEMDPPFARTELSMGVLTIIGAHDPTTAPWDIQLDTSDRRYVGTVATIDDIQRVMALWATTGECLGGRYFWWSDLIIVESLDRELIADLVEDLVQTKELPSAMTEHELD